MGKITRGLMLLVFVLAVATGAPTGAQKKRKPAGPPPRPTQARDRLHEMAKKSGGRFVMRYKPNRGTLYPNVEELAKRSDLIVVGRALSHRSKLRPDGNFITQDFLVKVQAVIKGDVPESRSIVVTLPGGSHKFADGTLAVVESLNSRRAENRGVYVFFLKSRNPNSPFGGHILVSETQGMFALTGGQVEPASTSADDPLVRNYRQMPAADFLREIHRVVPRTKPKNERPK
jgi:hypothetical protein